MNFKEYAVGTEHEAHTLEIGYFTAKIRKGKYVCYISCADTCPFEIARIDLPKEIITAKSLAEAKYKVAKIYEHFIQANNENQASLNKLWHELNTQKYEVGA